MENPDKYKNTRYFATNSDLEDIYRAWDSVVAEEELPVLEKVVRALAADVPPDARAFERDLLQHRKEHKITFRKASLHHVYHRLVGLGEIEPTEQLSSLLVKKSSKSQSGVLVITVLTSPYPTVDGKTQRFSCAWNCYYCPNEPGQPRSYLHDEPAVKRANENGFDPVLQFTDRAATLAMNGHPVDKIELLVLGGTWASYPHAYQEAFVRDLFFAANTFWQRAKRPRLSLLEEQTINETARVKIIGLTLETRPDTIDAAELRRLRRYGCTRVQLGVQHTDDRLLRKINRGHGVAHVAVALARLKDACFKVDVHLMPQLPTATLEDVRARFERSEPAGRSVEDLSDAGGALDHHQEVARGRGVRAVRDRCARRLADGGEISRASVDPAQPRRARHPYPVRKRRPRRTQPTRGRPLRDDATWHALPMHPVPRDWRRGGAPRQVAARRAHVPRRGRRRALFVL